MDDDTDEIREGLRAGVPAVLEWLGLGQPTSKTRAEWRYGNKGALVVTVRGPKAGLWHDHSAGEGGDMIALIRRQRGGEMRDAFAAARDFLGMPARRRLASSRVRVLPAHFLGAAGIIFSPDMAEIGNGRDDAGADDAAAISSREVEAARRRSKREAKAEREEAEAQREADAKRTTALALWDGATPIEGTHAAAYLDTRGLSALPDGGALRFVPGLVSGKSGKKFPGMVARVAEHDGTFRAVHRTFLHRERPEKATEAGGGGRLLLGSPGTGGVWLTKRRGPRLYVAEGIESALSVLRADPDAAVVAAISAPGLRNLALPDDVREVVILMDDDDPDPKTGKRAGPDAARAAAERWAAEGRAVWLARPRPSKGGGYDLNDLLRDHGADGVRTTLERAEIFATDAGDLAGAQIAGMVAEADDSGQPPPPGVVLGARPFHAPEAEDRIEDAERRLHAVIEDAVREGIRWAAFCDLGRHAKEAGIAIAIRTAIQRGRPDLARARYARKGDALRDEFRALAAQATREQWRLWRAALRDAGWVKPDTPPPLVVRASAGTGKTWTVLHAIEKALREVPGDDVPVRVAVLVPDHRLASEIAKGAERTGLAFAVLAGRGQMGRDGSPLCRRAAVAEKMGKAGVSVRRFLCGQPGEDGACPFRERCGYHAQSEGLPIRGILIGTQDALVSHNAEMSGGVRLPAFVVVDEGMTKKVTEGRQREPRGVSREALRDPAIWARGQ